MISPPGFFWEGFPGGRWQHSLRMGTLIGPHHQLQQSPVAYSVPPSDPGHHFHPVHYMRSYYQTTCKEGGCVMLGAIEQISSCPRCLLRERCRMIHCLSLHFRPDQSFTQGVRALEREPGRQCVTRELNPSGSRWLPPSSNLTMNVTMAKIKFLNVRVKIRAGKSQTHVLV